MSAAASTPPSDLNGASLWSTFGLRGQKNAGSNAAGRDTTPAPAPAPGAGVGAGRGSTPRTGEPDDIRAIFWEAYRHLFPPQAVCTQNESGSLVISWSMKGDPHARYKYAAPVVLRFEAELIETMAGGTAEQRQRMATAQETFLRAGLLGYDPYAGSQARIIVLG